MRISLTALCLLFLASPVTARGDNQIGLDYWNEIDEEAITTSSGLQYKVRFMGKGRKPGTRSTVSVHYRGLLLNGVVFDSSYEEDEPVELSLQGVIDGWKEGIPLMPVGSVFVFLIPPELGYGDREANGIPPNSTLIFEVELYKK